MLVWISRHTKHLLSIVGATIIFVTFLAKDVRKDALRALIDSIDAAETSFILRSEGRTTFEELQRFENEFVEYREHPKRRGASGFSGGSGSDTSFDVDERKVDTETLWHAVIEEHSTEEILDNVIRLERHLPGDPARTKTLAALREKRNSFLELSDTISGLSSKLPVTGSLSEYAPTIKLINHHISDLQSLETVFYKDVDGFNSGIVWLAELERHKAESNYEWWEPVTYGLYTLGWIIGVISIFFGVEQDPVSEAIAGES